MPNQAAQDFGRYDFVKDISRIEALVAAGTVDVGWAVAAGAGTTRDRQERLVLTGRHECRWRDYAIVADGSGRQHRWCYLAVRVPGDGPLKSAATTLEQACSGYETGAG